MRTIIGLTGFAGAGKDTAADILVREQGFTKISFASALKDMVACVFRWDRDLLEGSTSASREWREQIDPWWSNRLDMPALTPRYVLQWMGTEVMRNHFHDEIWIASIERLLETHTAERIVITDARFPNEFNVIRSKNGKLGQIVRDSATPDWYHDFFITSKIPDNVHKSETAWLLEQKDFFISNNGEIDDLSNSIKVITDRL